MKRALWLLPLVLLTGMATGQQAWHQGDLASALEAAKVAEKHVFVHFDSDN